VLATIANALSDCDANIENVFVDERDINHNALIFLIKVNNRRHLAKTFRKLRTIELVTSVSRT
jgi:guanosine-3',5'-bis(diphosphate) 3'-pyrophosphohydrolase